MSLGAGLAAAGLTLVAVPAHAAAQPDSFARTYLIANKASYHAKLTDPTLTNAWGLAAGPGTPIWVSDHNSGMAGIYSGGVKGGAGGKVPAHAVFKGLALATGPKAGPELFAADVANGRIDVFSKTFAFVKTPGEFRDRKIPAGFVPFNVQNLGGKLYVTYAKQNKTRTDVIGGKGRGFVDVYTVNGKLIKHLAGGGQLNAPWGLAIAPKGFGPFGGALLVGNLGNGWINAFNPATGKYLGWLDTPSGTPIAIPGLWGLEVGNSSFGGSSAVEFSAGPRGYRDGLVGILSPAKPAATGGGW